MESKRAGFTLIETLVALVVVALVMAVTQRGFVTARLGLERAQSTLAAEAVARSIVETELDLLAAAPGVRNGQTDGLAWTVTTEPIVLPLQAGPPPTAARPPTQNGAPVGTASAAQNRGAAGDAAAAAAQKQEQEDREASKWRPMRVTVAVANGLGRPFTIETLHLVKVE